MLMFHQVKPDWKGGGVKRLQTWFLHDPDKKVPFNIVNEGTKKRYLTGMDFDIESMQIVGDTLWFGDELGPYLVKTDRNNGEGLMEDACNGSARPDCQNVPAKMKRVYKVSLKDADADGFVKKIGYIDLLDIADPKGMAKRGTQDGKFTFPFVTIEDVDMVDADHIVVANDNNLPYSSGRKVGLQDDNEFILLYVPDFLRAR